MKTSETYTALSERIKSAKDKASLDKLETQITKQYEARTITAQQLGQLDQMIMHRLARLENPTTKTKPLNYCIKSAKGYLCEQGGHYWWQETCQGWALTSDDKDWLTYHADKQGGEYELIPIPD